MMKKSNQKEAAAFEFQYGYNNEVLCIPQMYIMSEFYPFLFTNKFGVISSCDGISVAYNSETKARGCSALQGVYLGLLGGCLGIDVIVCHDV